MNKFTYHWLTQADIDSRMAPTLAGGYPKPKWAVFCETMLREGFRIRIYEARETHSKYIWVCRGEKEFKVRFSNHPSPKHRVQAQDCDFYVGKVRGREGPYPNTDDAIRATLAFFAPPSRPWPEQPSIDFDANYDFGVCDSCCRGIAQCDCGQDVPSLPDS